MARTPAIGYQNFEDVITKQIFYRKKAINYLSKRKAGDLMNAYMNRIMAESFNCFDTGKYPQPERF